MRRFVGISLLPVRAQRGERLTGGEHHQAHAGWVGGEPGRVGPDPVEGVRDRHHERGVRHQPVLDVGADEGGESGLVEDALEVPDPGTGRAVGFAEHRLLLTDQHIPDDGAVPGTSDRGKAEHSTLTQGGRQLRVAAGGVAEEQHV